MTLNFEALAKLPFDPHSQTKYQSIMIVPQKTAEKTSPNVEVVFVGRQLPVTKFGPADLVMVVGCDLEHNPLQRIGFNRDLRWKFLDLKSSTIHSNMHLDTGIMHFHSRYHTFYMENSIVASWIIVEMKSMQDNW